MAKEIFANHLKPFDKVINNFTPLIISEKSFLELIKRMCDPNGIY